MEEDEGTLDDHGRVRGAPKKTSVSKKVVEIDLEVVKDA